MNTPHVSNQFPAHGGGAIIVTPEGVAYFPASRRMSRRTLADWIAAQLVSLPDPLPISVIADDFGPSSSAPPAMPPISAIIGHSRHCAAHPLH